VTEVFSKFNLADLEPLFEVFGGRLKSDVPLARYTAARIGGPAKVFLEVKSADELAEAMRLVWQIKVPYHVLGGGSNVLVSDTGVDAVVLHNRARQTRFNNQTEHPTVWAESGANFGKIARQAASLGLTGLEWAVGIPGTLGGAIVGNAGAHGSDISENLLVAEILQRHPHHLDGGVRESWSPERLQLEYRSSVIKRNPGSHVVLSAEIMLDHSTPEKVQPKIDEFVAYRQRTQPPGASMGSMFKNPSGDYAGRLIDAVGLKGLTVGDAQISELHANFFINRDQATAKDVYELTKIAKREVHKKFGIDLELEIELIGEW